MHNIFVKLTITIHNNIYLTVEHLCADAGYDILGYTIQTCCLVVCVCVCVCMCMWVCVCTRVRMHACMLAYVHAWVCACLCRWVCDSVVGCVCVCVCVWVCVFVDLGMDVSV